MSNEEHHIHEEQNPDEQPVHASEIGDEVAVPMLRGSRSDRFLRRRYTEGYTQYQTLGPNGKLVIHNVYTGNWYIQQLTKQERSRRRILYSVMCLAALAALVYGATRSVTANVRWYGGLLAYAGIYGLGWVGVGIFNEFVLPQRRTIGDYRVSSLSLKRGGLMSVCCCGGVALISLIYACAGVQTKGHLLSAGLELLATALAAGIRWLESKVEYKQEPSENAGKFTS